MQSYSFRDFLRSLPWRTLGVLAGWSIAGGIWHALAAFGVHPNERIAAVIVGAANSDLALALALLFFGMVALAGFIFGPSIPVIAERVRKYWERRDLLLGGGDTEVGEAVYRLAHSFSWGKWFAAQCLANNGKPIGAISLMHTAAGLVEGEAMAGRLVFRGRPPGATDYEEIPREAWRLIALGVKPHPRRIWDAMPVPRSEVDPARVQKFLDYDSIIVSSDEFEKLFPPIDKQADAERATFIKQAKKRKLDSKEIARLS